MAKDSVSSSLLNLKIKDIKKAGQTIAIILYVILVILTVGFNNILLYFTDINLTILSELIFMAVPFIILFYSYRKLKFLYYSYFFSAGYFMLTFSILNEVNTEQLQQLGYGNIDMAIGIIGWLLLFVLIYLPWKYKKLKSDNF